MNASQWARIFEGAELTCIQKFRWFNKHNMATESAAPKVEHEDTSAVGNKFQLRSLRPQPRKTSRAPQFQSPTIIAFDGIAQKLQIEQTAKFRDYNENLILKCIFGLQTSEVDPEQHQLKQEPTNVPDNYDFNKQTPLFLQMAIPKQAYCEICREKNIQYINHIQHPKHISKCQKSAVKTEIGKLVDILNQSYDQIKRDKQSELELVLLRSNQSKKALTQDTFPSMHQVPVVPGRKQRTSFFLQKSTQL